MMRTIVIALVVAAAVAACTYAVAASASGSGGPAAFALVDPNGGSPRLIADHTSGFVSVSVGAFGQGDYCLTPSAGVNVVGTAATATEEAFYSNAFAFVTVRYPTAGQNCAANQLEVKTFGTGGNLTDQAAFTVNVP
jgi:hypothetical protein